MTPLFFRLARQKTQAMFGLSKELSMVLLFFAWLPLHQGWAQPVSCCQVVKVKSQEAFNRQNYPEAIRNWTSGKRWADAVSKSPIAKPEADMVRISGGIFTMGCTAEQKDCGFDESPTTRVTVSDFYLGKYEVTFDEYDAFCTATGREKLSDSGWGRGQRPVINVSWDDVIAYCNWRSEKEGLTKVYTINGDQVTANWNTNGYRLPTEAEWEYAARGGGEAVLFGNGKNVADPREINFNASAIYKKPYSVAGEYRQKTVPVGSLNSPNSLGLHDMSGNVWEWCWDWYHSGYYAESNNSRDPRGPEKGSDRVIRGGGWYGNPQFCRVAYRNEWYPTPRRHYLGFRLARSSRS